MKLQFPINGFKKKNNPIFKSRIKHDPSVSLKKKKQVNTE